MKAVMYPLVKENQYLLEEAGLSQECELFAAVTLQQDDISPGIWNGIGVSADYEKTMEKADAVIITDVLGEEAQPLYERRIREACTRKKQVLLPDSIYERLCTDLVQEKKIGRIKELVKEDRCSPVSRQEKLKKIDIPVLSVMGFGENCGKFQTQLILRDELLKRGYRILQLGSNELSPVFGFSQLPDYIFDKAVALPEKIICFNHLIHDRIRQEHYDLVVVGCPGGFAPYHRSMHGNFGELPLIISQAMEIDINLLCLYANGCYDKDFLHWAKEYCRIRYNCEETRFCLTAQGIDYEEARSSFAYHTYEEAIICGIRERYQEREKKISRVYCRAEMEKEIASMIDTLAENPGML